MTKNYVTMYRDLSNCSKGSVMQRRGLCKIFVSLGLWCLSCALGDEARERHGFLWLVGLEVSGFGHSAGSARIDSVISGLYVNGEYIYHDIWKIGGEFVLGGGGALRYSGENLPIITTPNTEPTRKGSALLAFNNTSKFGYNLHAKAQRWDFPLYLNIVWRSDQLLAGQGEGVFSTILYSQSFYLELEARTRIASRTHLEYSAGAGYTMGYADFLHISDEKAYRARFKEGGLYLGGHLGVAYDVRDDVYFFTRLHARYYDLGESSSVLVPAAGDNKLTTDANVYYPKNSTYYVGVQFGFGF